MIITFPNGELTTAKHQFRCSPCNVIPITIEKIAGKKNAETNQYGGINIKCIFWNIWN
ncbi:MAG: hypothetical protein EZS28_029308, partial [Streblomastix strix]